MKVNELEKEPKAQGNEPRHFDTRSNTDGKIINLCICCLISSSDWERVMADLVRAR